MRRLNLQTVIVVLTAAALLGAACGSGAESDAGPTAGQAAETTTSTTAAIGSSSVGADGLADLTDDGSSGIELAATPEFCSAAASLIGSMEAIGHADLDKPAHVRLAYTDTEYGLATVADLAPNAGVATQIGEAISLFSPLAELLAANDWDVSTIDADQAAELAILSESNGPALSALTDEFEGYAGVECGIDVEQARADGVDRFFYDLSDTAPEPEPVGPFGAGTIDASRDVALVEAAPFGERGGDLFCAADRLLVDAIVAIDESGPDDRFVDALLASADVYTTWGERLPVALAVTTVEMTVAYAEVVATYGETQDSRETRAAYDRWRSSPELIAARSETNEWITANC